MSGPVGESHSPVHLVGQLISDGEDFAKAKVAVYRQLALFRVAQLRNAAIFGVAGAVLLHAALFVMLIGILMAVGHEIGFIWATVIVAGGTLLVGVALLLVARSAFPDFKDNPLDAPLGDVGETRS